MDLGGSRWISVDLGGSRWISVDLGGSRASGAGGSPAELSGTPAGAAGITAGRLGHTGAPTELTDATFWGTGGPISPRYLSVSPTLPLNFS